MVSDKKGRALRTYLQVTDTTQNKDQRDEISETTTSFDNFTAKKTSYSNGHCLVHASERYYQAQLHQVRAMHDEKFRLESLLLTKMRFAPEPQKVVEMK